MRNFINNMLLMAPLKREILRLALCCLMALILNSLLITGVEKDGAIKDWAAGPIGIFTSPNLLKFMLYFFLPFLAYTVLKAILLNANNAYSGFLGFLGNQLTGAMYCSGMVLASLAYKMHEVGENSYTELISPAAIILISGFLYFYILQCAIQRTFSPRVWDVRNSPGVEPDPRSKNI
ncbi:hypothetical protein ACXUPC_10640 [Pseudomonas marginalis]|jgi:hypothetical protein|uniref:hypothetical protein n=1 Tax=Pseudomonas marginalis TaxID=298 RepID=UPI0038B58AB0